jgi:hypothetical protein
MSRPEILFPLFAEITGLPGVGAKTAQLYEKLGVTRLVDLLFLLPGGLIDRRLRDSLIGVDPGQVVTVAVTVGEHYPPRSRSQPYRVHVQGGGVYLELVFFHVKGDWVQRALPPGKTRVISGKIESYDGRLQMPHPDLIVTEDEAQGLDPFEPVYPLTQGLGQRAIARAMAGALTKLPDLPEWLDPGIMAKHGWPGWAEALRGAHRPDSLKSLNYGAPFRQRLAYDELLSHQLALQIARTRMRRGKGLTNTGDGALRARAQAAFGFPPTAAQTRTCRIGQDLGGADGDAGGGGSRRAGRPDGADRDPGSSAQRRAGAYLRRDRRCNGGADRARQGLGTGRKTGRHCGWLGADRHRHPCAVPAGCEVPRPPPGGRGRTTPLRRAPAHGTDRQGAARGGCAGDDRDADTAHPGTGGVWRSRHFCAGRKTAWPSAGRDPAGLDGTP